MRENEPANVGKVALVTGASAGIGKATADLLTAQGWAVLGASRRGTGGKGWEGVVMDVNDDSCAEVTRQLVAEHGRIDALVASAGWGLAGPVETTPLTDAKDQFETNLWGVVRTVQAVLPSMRSQRSGRIVIMSSIAGVIGVPFQAFYSASKFALEGLGEALAYEVEPFGVKVTLVQPGNICTDFTANRRSVQGPDLGPQGAVYSAAMVKAIDVMQKDEMNGADVDVVAKAVAKVLRSRRPPQRVSVGHSSERIGLLGKRVLPFALFKAAARGALGA